MEMKARIVLFLLVSVFVLVCSISDVFASQELSNLDASVGVNPVFTITASPSTLNFGNVDPGTTTEAKDLYVSCVTNNNKAWSVSMNIASELTSGVSTVPNENFNWWGWSNGSGTWNAGTGRMGTTPFVFYQAGARDYITSPNVELHLTFNVSIPQNQAAGTYSTTLILTMTE
jgi:hypothetical protein